MEFRLIGVVFLIVGCSLCGFKMASDYRKEILSLRDLIDVLNYMECELNYRLTPLPQLCRLSAANSKYLKELFLNFADEMDAQVSTDTQCCMEAAIHKSRTCNSVTVFLRELGCSFGKFDLDGQLSGIGSVRQKCGQKLHTLEKDKDIRVRNYQTLGICAGVALAILLV